MQKGPPFRGSGLCGMHPSEADTHGLAGLLPGVISLAIAQGAGAGMRPSFGTAVSFGVLRLTSFGLLLAWTFQSVVRRIGFRRNIVVELSEPGLTIYQDNE